MDDKVGFEIVVVSSDLAGDADASLFAVDVIFVGAFVEDNLVVTGMVIGLLEVVEAERGAVEGRKRGEGGCLAVAVLRGLAVAGGTRG